MFEFYVTEFLIQTHTSLSTHPNVDFVLFKYNLDQQCNWSNVPSSQTVS